MGYSPWGHKEQYTTEQLSTHTQLERHIKHIVSWGCHNKVPQTRWLKTIETLSLTVLRPEALNQGVSRDVPSEGSREESFLVSSSFW